MQVVAHRGHAHLWRVLLLSAGIAFLWAVITLFAQTSASSAAQDDTGGKGLLGAVTSTVNHVTGAVGSTVGEVGTVTKTVVKAVEPVTEPVVAVAPKPVRETVKAVVTKTVQTVDKTTAAVDTTVRSVTGKTLTTVSDVAATTPLVGGLVGTPAPLTPVIPPVAPVLPGLGPVLGTTPDGTLPAVPGETPVVVLLPTDTGVAATPVTGLADVLIAAGAQAWRTVAVTTTAVVTAATSGILPFSTSGFPVEFPAPAPASSGALVLTFGALAVLAFARPRFAASFFRTSGPRDDALPGAPVYETDTSPG